MRAIEDVVSRLRGEFLEMPGLRLKSAQVQRLCGVERTVCKVVLDLLVDEKFLTVKSDGHYARLTTGDRHPAKADVRTDPRTEYAR
jgi:hypothetical protein